MNCKDGRYNCGTKVFSACVPYTGKQLTLFDVSDINCEPNINDVIEKLDSIIKTIKDSVDLTGLDKECFAYNPSTVTVAELSQIYTTELCAISAQLKALQDAFNDLDVLALPITLDLSCLYGTNCQPTTQTIGTILALFLSEICTLKSQINS
jgi:hypothetical protein